jgi:hypothetical protein
MDMNKILNGELFFLNRNFYSQQITLKIFNLLTEDLDSSSIFELEKEMNETSFFEWSLFQKKKISQNIDLFHCLIELLKSLNLEEKDCFFDLPRLRIIPTYLHKIPEAKPAFAIHRDTWYANSESQINFWIPLHSINHLNGFHFYLDYFYKSISNNSNEFDYLNNESFGGFGSNHANRIFPEVKEEPKCTPTFLKMNASDILIFSAHHLHGTSHNLSLQTRYSIDFRIVFKSKVKNYSHLKIDNFSKGDMSMDFLNIKTLKKLKDYL